MKKLIFCKSKVNSSGIRRENRDGVEHIIITSYTLPPDIVMNRGLYPAEAINQSYKTLERTLAPIEHPEANGQFISATDPIAINEFYGGAWNENVEQIEDGRIKVDKVVNVQEAMRSEKGKRLLDRINGLETGEDNRAIHTSVGVFLDVQMLDQPKTNAQGDEYDWIASDMVFDHDAILLDSVGAATPDKGVGIGVNSEQMDVEFVSLPEEKEKVFEPTSFLSNKDASFQEIANQISKKINESSKDGSSMHVVDIFEDRFVYETMQGELFQSSYSVEDGEVNIQNTRLPVERVIEYRPINSPNNDSEESVMRDTIIAELKKLGISVNADISDDELMAKYSEALVANRGDDSQDKEDVAQVVANAISEALKPVANELSDLKSKVASKEDSELNSLAEVVVNSDAYKGLDIDDIKKLGLEKVKSMAANCQSSFALSGMLHANSDNADDSYDMPE